MQIELRDIKKYFGSVRANDGIPLTIEPGAIYGLLGENGAGKTTLMKVLSGYLTPDSGTIVMDGKETSFSSPAEAIARGIGMQSKKGPPGPVGAVWVCSGPRCIRTYPHRR